MAIDVRQDETGVGEVLPSGGADLMLVKEKCRSLDMALESGGSFGGFSRACLSMSCCSSVLTSHCCACLQRAAVDNVQQQDVPQEQQPDASKQMPAIVPEEEVDEILDAAAPKPKRKRDGDDDDDMLPNGKQAKLEEELTEDELHTLAALTAAMDDDDEPVTVNNVNRVAPQQTDNAQDQYVLSANVKTPMVVRDTNRHSHRF
jgi:hypothetical protein